MDPRDTPGYRLHRALSIRKGAGNLTTRVRPMETDSTNHPRAVVQDRKQCQADADRVEYVGMRVDGTPVVLNLTEHERLSPDRSLELVQHSPAEFDWGYTGSGPAQLACALLLDYYDDERVAHHHYIQFRDTVVSQLV